MANQSAMRMLALPLLFIVQERALVDSLLRGPDIDRKSTACSEASEEGIGYGPWSGSNEAFNEITFDENHRFLVRSERRRRESGMENETSIHHALPPIKLLELITIYYSYRSIQQLNVYTCSPSDALFLLKALIQKNYIANVKSDFILPKYNSYNVEGNFVDLSCDKNRQEFDKIKKFRDVWLIWGGDVTAQFRLDSDLVLATSDGRLLDLSESIEPAGTWDPPDPRLPDRRKRFDLKGRTLVGAFLELGLKFNEKNKIEELSDNYIYPYEAVLERFSFVLTYALSQFYNFTLQLTTVDTWGMPQKNGSFNGMTGLLERNQADLGTFPCEMREERFRVVHFSQPLRTIRFIFFFLEERAVGTYKALIIPFTFPVWLCTIAIVIVGGIIFGLIHRGEHFHGVLFVIGVIAQQGLAVDSVRVSMRIFSTFLLILGLILYTYYNAAIMNGLLSPSPITIHNMEELKNSPFRIGIANIPYLNFDYNQRKYFTPDMLEHIKHKNPWLFDVAPGLEKVRRERFCICTDDTTIYPFVDDMFDDGERCNIREIEMVRPFPLSIPINKDTQYKEMIVQGTVRLIENGMAHRERKRWFPEKPPCLGSTVFSYVGLEAVAVAVICFVFGFIMCITIFAFELLAFKRAKRKAIKMWGDSKAQSY